MPRGHDQGGHRGALRVLGIGVLYAIVAVIATYPLAIRASSHTYGHGDPTLNTWAIAWVNHQLPRDPSSLFDGNTFYPYERSLAFSEHLFVPSLLAAPWLAVTGNAVLAHNAVLLFSMTLAALGMYLLTRELTGEGWPPFAAGLLYAFHTWNINELLRIQIVSNQWFPFLLLSLLRFFRAPGMRTGAVAGLLYALQSLSCMYWALYLPLVVLPAVAFLNWRHHLGIRKLLPLLVSLGAALLLTGIFAVPYLENSDTFNYHRDEPASIPMDRYLDVLPGNLLYKDILGTARVNENAAHFLGFSAMALALFGMLPRRLAERESLALLRPLLVFFVVAGFFLSLGPRIQIGTNELLPGPYALLYRWVPGFGSVRYPERFCVILVLGLAPLVGAGLARLQTFGGTYLTVVLTAFVLVEHLSVPLVLRAVPTGDAIPQVYDWIRAQPDARVVAEVPTTRYWGGRMDADAMYFSTVHWKRTVQGFTGYMPPTVHFIRWRLFHFPSEQSVAFLERLGIDTVVVRPGATFRPNAFHDGERWSTLGPFPGGEWVLRLKNASGLQFRPAAVRDSELTELDSGEWRVHASTPGAKRATDGDPSTTWSTVDFQREHHFYAIRFPKPTAPARISMEIGPPYEFPTRFEVLGLVKGGQWIDLPFDRARSFDDFFADLLYRPLEAKLQIKVDTREVREIRIRITETDPFQMPWTMSEIRVFRSRSP